MKKHVAIVSTTPGRRVAKYHDFDAYADAEAHVREFGGFVVSAAPSDQPLDWLVSGETVIVSPVEPTPREKIVTLEAEITPRRLREAVLTDAGRKWLDRKEAEIDAERGKIA